MKSPQAHFSIGIDFFNLKFEDIKPSEDELRII